MISSWRTAATPTWPRSRLRAAPARAGGIVVDPDYYAGRRVPNNGFQAMVRALEISMQEHARLLLRDADLVLRPRFSVPANT